MKMHACRRILGVLIVGITCFSQPVHSGVFLSTGGSQPVEVTPGASFNLPIQASGFTDVLLLQFTLEWNPEVLRYVSVGDYGLSGLGPEHFGYNAAHPNRLTVSWDDETGAGVSRNAGSTIFAVNFTAIGNVGSSSTVSFTDNPTLRQVVDINLQELTFEQSPGTVTVVPEPVNVAITVFGVCFCVVRGLRFLWNRTGNHHSTIERRIHE